MGQNKQLGELLGELEIIVSFVSWVLRRYKIPTVIL